MDKIIAAVMLAVFGLATVVFLAWLFALVTQYAWSQSVAQIFHLPLLNFWQAFWLNILGGILCKGSSSSKS